MDENRSEVVGLCHLSVSAEVASGGRQNVSLIMFICFLQYPVFIYTVVLAL